MMQKRWIVKQKKTDDIIDQLLINRGIPLSEKNRFLHPDFSKDLENPFKIKDMDKLVKRFEKAIKNNEKIGIFADYDADGIPGAALLKRVCEILGLDVSVYIPSRKEGYGLNIKGIQELKDKGCSLLISIDLGITNKKEVEFAKKIGMDVVITDHHEIQDEKFPKQADIIIHTHLSKDYINKDLAGGAVAYKIAQAFSEKLGKPTTRELKWLLDLPAICTICDIVPLTGENRLLAKYGLIVLSKTKNLGLKKMYEIAAIDENKMDAYTVGFLIGPRINAPGRMQHAQLSYFLLTTNDDKEAKEIANEINNINISRQKSLEQILAQALRQIKKDKLDKNKIIVIVGKNDWPAGLIGLVSSKITDQYCRPSIVFAPEDGMLRGSARSIDKFDIVDNLLKTKELLVSVGGHTKAAGLALKKENYNKFYKKICHIANEVLTDEDLVKEIEIEARLQEKHLNLGLIKDLKLFEPFGLGNPKPVFLLENAKIKLLTWMGKDKNHLKIKIVNNYQSGPGKKEFDIISFNCKEELKHLKNNDNIDVVFTLEENIWNGRKSLQLKLVDIKKI